MRKVNEGSVSLQGSAPNGVLQEASAAAASHATQCCTVHVRKAVSMPRADSLPAASSHQATCPLRRGTPVPAPAARLANAAPPYHDTRMYVWFYSMVLCVPAGNTMFRS